MIWYWVNVNLVRFSQPQWQVAFVFILVFQRQVAWCLESSSWCQWRFSTLLWKSAANYYYYFLVLGNSGTLECAALLPFLSSRENRQKENERRRNGWILVFFFLFGWGEKNLEKEKKRKDLCEVHKKIFLHF